MSWSCMERSWASQPASQSHLLSTSDLHHHLPTVNFTEIQWCSQKPYKYLQHVKYTRWVTELKITSSVPMQTQHYFNIEIYDSSENTLESQDNSGTKVVWNITLSWSDISLVSVKKKKKKQKCIGYLLIATTPVNILCNQSATENQQLTPHEVLWPASDFHVGTCTNN